MTIVQEAISIMERMPRQKQQAVLELLRIMSNGKDAAPLHNKASSHSKRTGRAKFQLPVDFDEHFDDLNDEIAKMFSGENS